MNSFTLCRSRRFLRVVAAGFWDVAELVEYDRRFRQQLGNLRALGCTSRMLLDARDFAVHSRDLDEAFRAHLAAIEPLWPDRVAVIVAHAVQKIQAKRMLAGTQIQPRFFSDERAAMQWLFESNEAVATAA